MIKYTDIVKDERSQSPIEGAEVYVYNVAENDNEATTLATLFADDGTTEIGNPLTTNNLGVYSFYHPATELIGDVYVGARLRYRSRLFVGGGYAGAAQAAAAAAQNAVGVESAANTGAGLAATAIGETFWVNNGDGTGITYRHDPGPVATEVGRFIIDPTDSGASALIGFEQGGAGAKVLNVESELRQRLAISQFTGADPSGVGDSTTAIEAAIARAVITGQVVHVDGRYRHTSQITVPAYVRFRGSGSLTSDAGQRSPSCFIKDFNGLGFYFEGADTGTDGVQYDSIGGRTGDLVQVAGTRWLAPSICVTNGGRDNLRIGTTEVGYPSANTNAWYIGRLQSYEAGRYGLHVHSENGNLSDTYPIGSPDCNAGTLMSADFAGCDTAGWRLGNTLDNWLGMILSHDNPNHGGELGAYARNNIIQKSYTERNGVFVDDVLVSGGDGVIEENAFQNVLWLSRGATLANGWTDDSGNTSNQIWGHNSTLGSSFDDSPWYVSNNFYVFSATNSASFRHYVGENVVPSEIRTETDGVSGTKLTIATRTSGNDLIDKVLVSQDGFVDLLIGDKGLRVAGTKVVGSQQAAIAAPTGGATTDAEARTAIGSILTALRSHGLIAT